MKHNLFCRYSLTIPKINIFIFIYNQLVIPTNTTILLTGYNLCEFSISSRKLCYLCSHSAAEEGNGNGNVNWAEGGRGQVECESRARISIFGISFFMYACLLDFTLPLLLLSYFYDISYIHICWGHNNNNNNNATAVYGCCCRFCCGLLWL